MRQVRLLRDYGGLGLVSDLRPRGQMPQSRFVRDRDWVVALDTLLTTQRHVLVPARPGQELLAADPQLGLVVVADAQGTELHGFGAHVPLPVAAADAAVLLEGARLLLAAPHPTLDSHQVHLVDLRRRTVVDVVDLDCEEASAVFLSHPHDGSVLIDLREGMNGSRLYGVHLDAGRLRSRELLQDTVPSGFNPSGTHLLVLPHPSFDEEVWLASWPDGEPVTSLSTADVGLADDAFDVTGCFLDDHSVLLLTTQGRVVLTDGRLGAEQVLELAPGVTELVGLWPGVFATQHLVDGAGATRVWQLSPP
jgi:hypothetical protein